MFGVAGIREVRESTAAYAAGFDAALVSGADAQVIVSEAVAAENMLATIKAMAARGVRDPPAGAGQHRLGG